MMFQAVLSNRDHPEYGVATIPFPIPHDQYAHCIRQEPNCPLWLALFVKHNCCLDQYCEVPSNIKLHASPSIHRLEMPLEIALKNSVPKTSISWLLEMF